MKRYIYAFNTAEAARKAVTVLRSQGVKDDAISLIARSDIEMEEIPSRFLDASTDFVPALARGATFGGATGLIAGLIALAIPPLGITMAGPALIGFFGGGALLGAWSAALVGASVPDDVRRKFEDEIKAGRTLLVVHPDEQDDAKIVAAMADSADAHLIWQSEIDSLSG